MATEETQILLAEFAQLVGKVAEGLLRLGSINPEVFARLNGEATSAGVLGVSLEPTDCLIDFCVALRACERNIQIVEASNFHDEEKPVTELAINSAI